MGTPVHLSSRTLRRLRVSFGLMNDVLDDLLLLLIQDLGETFVQLWLLLLELCRR